MTHIEKPQNLKDFLAAYDRGSRSVTTVEPPAPELLRAEESFLRALYDFEPVVAPAPSMMERFFGELRSWFAPQRAYILVGAAALVCVVGGLSYFNEPEPSLTYRKGSKFGHPRIPKKSATLFVGCWDQKRDKFKRLGSGERCQADQSLLFGFSLVKEGGYAYLFRLRKEESAPTLLYPFSSAEVRVWEAGKMHLVRRNSGLQEYQLRAERKQVTFVLLQTSRRLLPSEFRRLTRRANEFGEELKALRGLKGLQPSYDRFSVVVDDVR